MNKLLLLTTTAAFTVGVASAVAGELPSFERSGLPITTHQVSVLGSSYVRERSTTPTLTLRGMPASPHQIAVLTPRRGAVAPQISSTVVDPVLVSGAALRSGH